MGWAPEAQVRGVDLMPTVMEATEGVCVGIPKRSLLRGKLQGKTSRALWFLCRLAQHELLLDGPAH